MRHQRNLNDLRPLNFGFHLGHHADGFCVASMGKTQVLCTARIDHRVPPHLRGKGGGWVTAEYCMLPNATHQRIGRQKALDGGRSKEISRLIGRSLRAVCHLSALGERQIVVDCDVLHADGGTRTCAINGAYIALYKALKSIKRQDSVLHSPLAAVSCALIGDTLHLDPDYHEDSAADADANFVVSSQQRLIECQATAESRPIAAGQLTAMLDMVMQASTAIMNAQQQALGIHDMDAE